MAWLKKLSEATYLALKFGEPLDWRGVRWLVAERMRWTLEYVDSLDVGELQEGLAVWRGKATAQEP